jgi:peptide/nickel transport system permease protein
MNLLSTPRRQFDSEAPIFQILRFIRRLAGTREGAIGVLLTLLVLFVAVVGPHITPYSPFQLDLAPPNARPSLGHWLGTDQLGRDVLSRLLAGGTLIIIIPLVAVSSAYLIGGIAGLGAAYVGGRTDSMISAVFDIAISIPRLLVMLILVGSFGSSSALLIFGLAIADVPSIGRMVRGVALAQVANDYVTAARARGETVSAILFRELLPNLVAPLVADFTLRITFSVIALSTLSFLGLGAQPPRPDWGLMIQDARPYAQITPWAILAPAAMIAALSVGLSLIADAFVATGNRYAMNAQEV